MKAVDLDNPFGVSRDVTTNGGNGFCTFFSLATKCLPCFLQGNMKQHALTHKNSSIPLSPNSNSNSQFNNSSDSEDKLDPDDDLDRDAFNGPQEVALKRSPPREESDDVPQLKRANGETLICVCRNPHEPLTILPHLKTFFSLSKSVAVC